MENAHSVHKANTNRTTLATNAQMEESIIKQSRNVPAIKQITNSGIQKPVLSAIIPNIGISQI